MMLHAVRTESSLKEIDKDGAYKAALEKWGVEQGAISDFAVNPTS